MWSNLPASNSEIKGTDRVMSVGMLTGRPEEEMSGFSGDLLQELSQMHEQARQAMRSVAKALCPSASPPGKMEELIQLFKGARRCFQLLKISACREGAREGSTGHAKCCQGLMVIRLPSRRYGGACRTI